MNSTFNARPTLRRCNRFAALLCVVVAIWGLASSQVILADEQVPFRAAFNTEFQSVVDFPLAHIRVVGKGRALHLGMATAVTTDQEVNLLTGAAVATYTLTAANGDTVVVELEFQGTNRPGGVTFEGTYKVAKGTGRFAGATGQGWLSGWAVFVDADSGFGFFTLVGTISSPGRSR